MPTWESDPTESTEIASHNLCTDPTGMEGRACAGKKELNCCSHYGGRGVHALSLVWTKTPKT